MRIVDDAVRDRHFISPAVEKRIREIAARYQVHPRQLMNILLEIQKETSNSFPHSVAALVCPVTGIPEAKLLGFVSFYSMFSQEPAVNMLYACATALHAMCAVHRESWNDYKNAGHQAG